MRTLVLNAGYEPLSIVTARRAALLVLRGTASVLAEEGVPIISPGASLPRPAVIILHRYVRVSRRRPGPPSRRVILRRDSRVCAYCLRPAATVDHVVPRSKGGGSSWENLVACCSPCNMRKGNKTLEELGWRLQITPARPAAQPWLGVEMDAPREVWKPYLRYAAP